MKPNNKIKRLEQDRQKMREIQTAQRKLRDEELAAMSEIR